MNYHPMSHEYLNLPLISHGSHVPRGASPQTALRFAWPRWMWAAWCRKVPEPSYICHTVSYVIMCKHTNIYAHIDIHICICIYICMYAYTHTYIHICIYIYTIFNYIYIYIHTYIHKLYSYTYIYTFTYTYTHCIY